MTHCVYTLTDWKEKSAVGNSPEELTPLICLVVKQKTFGGIHMS